MQHIVSVLQKSGFMLTAVHLVDSYYCSDPGNFIAALMTSLQTMMKSEFICIHSAFYMLYSFVGFGNLLWLCD